MLESLAFLDLPCQDFLYLDDGDLGNIGPMTTIGDRIRAARKAAEACSAACLSGQDGCCAASLPLTSSRPS